MMAQMQLLPMEGAARSGTMAERFEEFHRLNPHVYELIMDIALELKKAGHQRAGMKLIFERIRWLYYIGTKGDDFKLNNNYTAFYARLVMEHRDDLEGFFQLRRQRCET